MITVKTSGLAEAERLLKTIGDKIGSDVAFFASRKTMKEVYDVVKAKAPVSPEGQRYGKSESRKHPPGTLKAAIKMRKTRAGAKFGGHVIWVRAGGRGKRIGWPDAYYWRWREVGHLTGKNGKYQWTPPDSYIREPIGAHMKTAVYEYQNIFIDRTMKLVEKHRAR